MTSQNLVKMSGGFIPIPNDRVVTQDEAWGLHFGVIKRSTDGKFLKVLWESGSVSRLPNGPAVVSKIGVYDRPLPIGSLVRHLGKQGRVFSSHKIVTAVCATQNGPCGRILFPNLREHYLYPVLVYKVGDTVMYNGWIGLVTKGVVEVTYEFESGLKCLVKEDLESVQGYDYPGKAFSKLPSDVLDRGKWSGGLRFYNLLKYRNKSAVLLKLEIVSLSIFWIDRIKTAQENNDTPPTEITDKIKLAMVFGLDNPTNDKFQKDSVFLLRWDESLVDNYRNWQDSFVSKHVLGLGNESDDDEEPMFKKAKETYPFTNKDRVAVKVLLSQTEVEIMFDDESTGTIMAKDITEVIPTSSKPLQFPDVNYMIGDVVRDKMDFLHPQKYGFILSQNNERRTCHVKWITLNRDKSITSQTKEMSQYDIHHFSKYQLLKNSPQVILAKGIFEGVILGLSLLDGKVKVQCAEGPVKTFYPHELKFSTKKVFKSPVDQSLAIRSIQVESDLLPKAPYFSRNSDSAILHKTTSGQRTKIFVSPEVPSDHSFFDVEPRKSGMDPEIAKVLTQDIFELVTLPTSNVWVERFQNRSELLTAAIVGPSQTIYSEVMIFVDVLIPVDYPHSVPEVVFRLPRIYRPEWFNPYLSDDGQLRIPLEVLQSAGSYESTFTRTFNFILRKVLCNEPYLSSQNLVDVFETNNNNNNPLDNNIVLRQMNNSKDFNETAIITISEYIHATLCKPPDGWKDFVGNHYHQYLQRICWRFLKYMEIPEGGLEENVVALNERSGCGFLIHPTSESFKLAMKTRLEHFNPFLEVL